MHGAETRQRGCHCPEFTEALDSVTSEPSGKNPESNTRPVGVSLPQRGPKPAPAWLTTCSPGTKRASRPAFCSPHHAYTGPDAQLRICNCSRRGLQLRANRDDEDNLRDVSRWPSRIPETRPAQADSQAVRKHLLHGAAGRSGGGRPGKLERGPHTRPPGPRSTPMPCLPDDGVTLPSSVSPVKIQTMTLGQLQDSCQDL